MLKPLLLLCLLSLTRVTEGCADFLIFLNAGQTTRSTEATRELALSLVDHLEIDSQLHRVALSTSTDPENEVVDFGRIKTSEQLKEAILEWKPEQQQLTIASKGLESRLEKTARLAVSQRRPNTAVPIILVDDDGNSAFMTNPTNFGSFSGFVNKRHYVHVLLVSRKAERIRTALDFAEANVDTASNRDEFRLIASPFTKCQLRSGNELRRRPLPRINSPSNNNAVLTSKSPINDQQSLIVTSRFFTVPVSVRFSTTKKPNTTQTLTTTNRPSSTPQLTTLKPKKAGCQYDIVILFDLSSNSQVHLERYKQMTLSLIEQSELGKQAAQFSLIRYSGPKRAETAFHFNKHSNKTLLIKEVENILPLGGTTRTAEAMQFAAQEFDPKFGGRPKGEVQRHIIVFTNGYSRDNPEEVAQSLAREQIHVFSVAVEDPNLKPDVEQLRLIASDAKSALLDAQFGKIVEQLAPTKCKL